MLSEISQGSVQLLGQAQLSEKLAQGKSLRIKAGFDPTAPDLHLGHTVLLTKLKQLQQLGHHVIFVVGDFTALIGDPTFKNKTRPPLTAEVIAANMASYSQQYTKVLDAKKTECRFNSEWLGTLSAKDLIQLAAQHTVARMLERDDFAQRYQKQEPIAIHEFLYPMLQAYDSVYLEIDLEIGGTDQLFNLLCGRELQKQRGLSPQAVLTLPLLEGVDGVQKMSKSLNNAIGLQEEAFIMYSKLMSISDKLMWRYFELLSLAVDNTSIKRMQEAVAAKTVNPRDYKMALAIEITQRYHGVEAATQSRDAFRRQFQERCIPSNVPEVRIALQTATLPLANLLKQAQLAQSTSIARRLIQSGAVYVDRNRVTNIHHAVSVGSTHLYQVGRRQFKKISLVKE